jgi:hypothetical protein
MDYRIRNSSYAKGASPDAAPELPSYPIIRDNREFGTMEDSMIIDMFEETNVDYNEEEIYDSYARTTLQDRTPDKNKMEYEEPRGGVNQNAGILQLHYNGHRGEADTPYMPEIFTGFMGGSDRDPRGINQDPDFKQLSKQEEARMRFVRFSKDDSRFVIDGHRAERRELADKQTIFKINRDRLRVFDRQLDGRTSGKSGTLHDDKSNVCKQVVIQSYGDRVLDAALTPQRKATLMCNNIIRDSKEYRDSATDQDMDYMRYTLGCKKAKAMSSENKSKTAATTIDTTNFGSSDKSKSFKAVGLLMKNACQARHNMIADGDIDMSQSRNTVSAKTAPIARDISLITKNIKQEGEFSASSGTQSRKTATPQDRNHTANVVDNDRYLNEMHYNNALTISKAAKHGNIRDAANNIITDAKQVKEKAEARPGKSANPSSRGGLDPNVDYDTDQSNSMNTYQYKASARVVKENKVNVENWENFAYSSDISQSRKTPGQAMDNSLGNVVDYDAQFSANLSKERHSGGLGKKYMVGMTEEDGRADEKFQK